MFPMDLRYTQDHEWIRADGGEYTVGITNYAAEQLGDVTFVELPEVGATVTKGTEAGAVESVKAASDVYAPVGGTVTAVNEKLEADPSLANSSPYEDGWFYKLGDVDPAELKELMNAAAYEKFVEEDDH